MRQIPRFSICELPELMAALAEAGIESDFCGTTISVSQHGRGVTEYYIEVNDEDYEKALAVLMDCYGIPIKKVKPFVGPCPACGYDVKHERSCPDCGISFAPGDFRSLKRHSFYRFLKQEGLLPKKKEKTRKRK